ncbi:two-component sensor NtrB [Pseudomonas aeruginosa]|nr:two-component sensor NtrB [Pseudomonas aeruginosa]
MLERVSSLVEAESQGSITLVRDYDPSIPDLLLDREQMIQAVLNMVRNAMQAIRGQNDLRLGRITLRSRTLRQFTIGHTRHRLVCKVEIIDNGRAFPPSSRKPSSTPWSAAAGRYRTRPGHRPEHHQPAPGLIECESHPGHTVFSLFLPLEQGVH